VSEHPYDLIGPAPSGRGHVSESELDEAIAAWDVDHPTADDDLRRAVMQRLRRLNADAKEREDADAAGTTVLAMRRAKAEAAERRRIAKHARDMDAARVAIADGEALPRGVSQGRLDRYAKAAIARREPDGTWPTQAVVADGLLLKDDRAIRQVGWALILRRAEQIARQGGGTTG
jgi:hypothetical protein